MISTHVNLITVGRADNNHVVLTAPEVSGRHARFYGFGDRWFVEDCGSANGTAIETTRLPPHIPVEVFAGQPVHLGSVALSIPPCANRGNRSPITTLRSHISAAGKLTYPRVVPVLDALTRELSYQHDRGRARPRLAPETIIIVEFGAGTVSVLLLDKFAACGEPTPSGDLLYEYAAPEQFKGHAPDARRDVYAVGLLAYEMLAGHLPFEGGTPWAWATQHLTAVPPSLRDLVPEFAADAVDKALQKPWQARQATVREFYEEFAAAERAPSGIAKAVGAFVAVPEVSAPLSAPQSMLGCHACQTSNLTDARFCVNCGALLPMPPSPKAVANSASSQLMNRPHHERLLVIVGEPPPRTQGLAFIGGAVGIALGGPIGAALGAAAGAIAERSLSPAGSSKLTPLYIPLEVAMRQLPLPPGQILPGRAYRMHPLRPERYLPIETFHRRMFEDKCTELHNLLCALGAIRIEMRARRVQWTSGGVAAEVPVDIQGLPFDLGIGASGRHSRVERGVFVEEYTPVGPPRLPDDLVWYPSEDSWRGLAQRRLQWGATGKFSGKFQYKDDFGVSLDLKFGLEQLGLSIGVDYDSYGETEISFDGEYA